MNKKVIKWFLIKRNYSAQIQPGVSVTKEFDFYGKERYDQFEVYYFGRRFIDVF